MDLSSAVLKAEIRAELKASWHPQLWVDCRACKHIHNSTEEEASSRSIKQGMGRMGCTVTFT